MTNAKQEALNFSGYSDISDRTAIVSRTNYRYALKFPRPGSHISARQEDPSLTIALVAGMNSLKQTSQSTPFQTIFFQVLQITVNIEMHVCRTFSPPATPFLVFEQNANNSPPSIGYQLDHLQGPVYLAFTVDLTIPLAPPGGPF